MPLLYLSSGLFLGWSLGANDAANVFGTAVGTRMVRFRTAATVSSVFIVLGAVIGGAGTSETLSKLGAVSAPAGAFMVALAAGLAVLWMTRLQLPVSITQSIVGAIVGWNLFCGSPTDAGSLATIVSTWIFCPLLSAAFAVAIFLVGRSLIDRVMKVHLLERDAYIRVGLLAVGAFGSYALGANNIANVVGVFLTVSPFPDFVLPGGLALSGSRTLLLVGGLAIATGVFTYSERVMRTVGRGLFRLSPGPALTVVLAQSFVLFLFSSEGLERILAFWGLPPLPLVPVSSSQAVVGAILGIALLRGIRGVRYRTLGGIALGWVATPVVAGLIAFVGLFFLQNLFGLPVDQPAS